MPRQPTSKIPAGEGSPFPAIPPLLGSSKADVDKLLGRPVMARGLLGMTAQGEKAYAYAQAGDHLIVGFFNGVARYLAVVRKSGPKTPFSSAETASILALNGSPSLWKSEPSASKAQAAAKPAKVVKKSISPALPTTYFSLALSGRDIVGWQPGDKPFLFFLLPAHPGHPHLLLNEWQVARAIG